MDSLLEDVETAEQLDGVFLLTSGGDMLGGWSRGRVRQEVLSIMSATMIGSVDVLLEELRGQRPRQVLVEAGGQRLLVMRTQDDNLLVMLAPLSLSRKRLSATAQILLDRLFALPARAESKSHVYVTRD